MEAHNPLSLVTRARGRRLALRKGTRWHLRTAASEANGNVDRGLLKSVRRLMVREETLLSTEAKAHLEDALSQNQTLAVVYEYKQRLQAIWQERSLSQEGLLQALQDWCRQAEETGIRALQDFARRLPTYSMQPAVA